MSIHRRSGGALAVAQLASRTAQQRKVCEIRRELLALSTDALGQVLANLEADPIVPSSDLDRASVGGLVFEMRARLAARRAREYRAGAAAGVAALAALAGPELEARRRSCHALHLLRSAGWRPLPDGRWLSPTGERREFDAAACSASFTIPAHRGGAHRGASRTRAAPRGEGAPDA